MEPIRQKYIIIGAGPAGLQLGYFLHRRGSDYLILERGDGAGTFFERFPRHRMLISINKRFTGSDDPGFNMRHDWNSLLTEEPGRRFTAYDSEYFPAADSLVTYLNDFAGSHELNIRYGADVARVSSDGSGYRLRLDDGEELRAEVLIVATGLYRPYIPDIPGIELADNYVDMSLDRSQFENKRVLVVGKGNSGFETADYLVPAAAVIHLVSPRSLTMAWKSHYVGHLRAVNNNILDTYQLKSQNAVIDADVRAIAKVGDQYDVTFAYRHAQGEVETIRYDHVLCCTGFRMDDRPFDDSTQPQTVLYGKYPELTNEFESVNRKNMYFAGTLTHSLDYRKTTSGFIHGLRYNARALSEILASKYEGAVREEQEAPRDAVALAKLVLDRVNRSGALWQQPGFIADYFYEQAGLVRYGCGMPLGYIRDQNRLEGGEHFVVTLEYGEPITGDPFSVERVHRENVQEAMRSQFLHPVVRKLRDGQPIDEHHVIEDLESRWVEPVHIDPLAEFLQRCLNEGGVPTDCQADRDDLALETV